MWEIEIIKYIQNLKNPFFDAFFSFFTFLASFWGVLILFFAFLLFLNKRYAIKFFVVYVINIGINFLLKIVINRPRPFEVSNEVLNSMQALGKSFPSGHMVSATTISFFICLYLFKKYKSFSARLIIIVAHILFLVCVGISRMYLGQHYLTDLIAGVLVGFILSLVFNFLAKYV